MLKMKVIHLTIPTLDEKYFLPAVISIGNFDGVHLGHKQVVTHGQKIAQQKGLLSGVLTFYPHPKEVLGKNEYSRSITPIEDKINLFRDMGLDLMYVIEFNNWLSKLSPKSFINNYIINLNIKHVVIGYDYRFGYKGQGTPTYMKENNSNQFQVDVIEAVNTHQTKISSTLIRQHLAQGNIKYVNKLLGRHYSLKVNLPIFEHSVHKEGQLFTKLHLDQSYLLPAPGLYSVYLLLEKHSIQGKLYIDDHRQIYLHQFAYQSLYQWDVSRHVVNIHFADIAGASTSAAKTNLHEGQHLTSIS